MRLLSSNAATIENERLPLDFFGARWKAIKINVIVFAALILLFSVSLQAREQIIYFNIPQQSVNEALIALGEQADVSVIYHFLVVGDIEANSLHGRYSIRDGVKRLLKNTNLIAEFNSEGHLIVSMDINSGRKEMNTRKNILASTIAVFLGAGGQLGYAEVVSEDEEMDWLLEEVVVTATKRATSLQDAAMSITALDAEDIERKSLVNASDYLNAVPGVLIMDTYTSQE